MGATYERQLRRARSARQGLFLLLLIVGMVWGTSSTAIGGATGFPAAVMVGATGPAANQDSVLLADHVTSNGGLAWDWLGAWGSVESKAMYTVDLDGMPGANRYYLGVYLINAPSGFADLQLQLRIADVGAAGECDAGAIESSSAAADRRVMTFESSDAQVTFSGMAGETDGLPGATTYCVGVASYADAGRDAAGTFIRKSSAGPGFDGTYPRFVAALDRMGG